MKAVIYSAEVPHYMSVTERPVPVPSASPARLLVRVKAASLNPVDYKLGSMPLIGRFKRGGGVGLDFSGVIEGLPEGYTGDLKSGDEVFGHSTGTLAEFCLCAPDEIARKPANMSFVEAASIPTTGLTSLQSLRIGGIEAGKEILVIGASGGCGTMGVQIAKALGARVTGICGTANVDFVRSLGADVVLDYNDKAAIEGLKTGGAKFDVIYDTVTSPEDTDYSFLSPSLKPTGRWVAINGQPSDWLRKLLPLVGERKGYNLISMKRSGQGLAELAKWAEEGKLKAIVEGTYKLDEAGVKAAVERLKSRRTRGKVVIECE